MRINTLIDKLCVKDELDKEDLGIINSLLKEKYSESKNYDKKLLIDSVALIYYAMTKENKVVLYLSPKIEESLVVKKAIEELIKNSSFTKKVKKEMFVKVADTKSLMFFNGTRIVFGKSAKRAAIGYTINWILINDIRLTEPGIYEAIFANLYPVMNAMRDGRMTLSA
jgi:hypothetical protein